MTSQTSKVEKTIFATGKAKTRSDVKDYDEMSRKPSRELDQLVKESARILLDIKSVFPFNFFPDELVVDEHKVSIHTNYFFFSRQVRSIEYKDIFNVLIEEGVFFAKLEITDRFFSKEKIIIEYLKKGEAIQVRRIIQGLVIATKRKIDIHALALNALKQKLERIGESR